jgi:oxygen-independent coproporphyrinogen-3 oxidase
LTRTKLFSINSLQLFSFAVMAGIYIHIPFCKQKCTYCDFHFSTTFHGYRNEMIQTLISEIGARNGYLGTQELKSLYFGGGTPSLLTKVELEQIVSAVRRSFTLLSDAEVTLEANPDDITDKNLTNWLEVGINRLSIGIQSFKESDLKWMNRAHTVQEASNCVQLAQQKGIKNISVDLIYGLPELTLDQWAEHIDRVLQMGVQHISAYCLTVEEKTALHKLVTTHKLVPAGEDDQSEQFLLLSSKLKEAGYLHYEISNFGLPGFEAVHNSNYWKGQKYLGIGPSAHSFNGTSRRWNVSNNSLYIKNFGTEDAWFEEEQLSAKDQWNELILTGLRTSYGVNRSQLASIHDITEEFATLTDQFIDEGLMTFVDDVYYLTDEGRLQADHIASELFL